MTEIKEPVAQSTMSPAKIAWEAECGSFITMAYFKKKLTYQLQKHNRLGDLDAMDVLIAFASSLGLYASINYATGSVAFEEA